MIQPDMLHIGDAHKTNVDVDSYFPWFRWYTSFQELAYKVGQEKSLNIYFCRGKFIFVSRRV